MNQSSTLAVDRQRKLPRAVGIYLATGVLWLVGTIGTGAMLTGLGLADRFGFLAWISPYLVAGFVLNRVVLRDLVEFHPMYATIENLAGSKLRMLLFWPLSYPKLFITYALAKHL